MTAISPTVTYLGTGGNYALQAGTLPTGVSLTTSTGIIFGTSSSTVDATGAAHQITVRITNSKGFVDHNIDLSEYGTPRLSYPGSIVNYFREDSMGAQYGLPASPAPMNTTIAFCKVPCTFSSSHSIRPDS